MPLYLITKKEVIDRVDKQGNAYLGHSDYYPRLVLANSPEHAIEVMFLPEQYRPGKNHTYQIYELVDEGTYNVRVNNYNVVRIA